MLKRFKKKSSSDETNASESAKSISSTSSQETKPVVKVGNKPTHQHTNTVLAGQDVDGFKKITEAVAELDLGSARSFVNP